MGYAAGTHFRTRSFAEGVAMVEAIGRASGTSSRRPDVDLRADGVTVRLTVNEQGELGEDVMPFWAAVLGYREFGDIVTDPYFTAPVWFQQMDDPSWAARAAFGVL